MDNYQKFLRSKIQVVEKSGFDVSDDELNPEYYAAGVKYCEAEQRNALMPSLFDFFSVKIGNE